MLAWIGCKPEEGTVKGSLPEDKVIRVDAGIVPVAESGTDLSQSYTGSAFGLWINPKGEADGPYAYRNIRFVSGQEGWTSDSTLLWKNDKTPYEAVAYAPFSGTSGEEVSEVGIDLTGQTAQNQADKEALFVKMDINPGQARMDGSPVSLVEGRLPIRFQRKLSKLIIQCTYGDEFGSSQVEIDSVTVLDLKVKGKMNLPDGTLETDPETARMRTVTTQDYLSGSSSHQCLVLPQSGTFQVKVFVNGREFTYRHTTAHTFEEGTQYRLGLKVGKDIVRMGDLAIEEWQDGGSDRIETE